MQTSTIVAFSIVAGSASLVGGYLYYKHEEHAVRAWETGDMSVVGTQITWYLFWRGLIPGAAPLQSKELEADSGFKALAPSTPGSLTLTEENTWFGNLWSDIGL